MPFPPKHGHALKGKRSPTYICWVNMRGRCRNPKHKLWDRYGGRGITVCERWDSFEAFLEDMGEKPFGLSIDRIDNDKGYSPDNCRWADDTTQSRNKSSGLRRITYQGQTKCLTDWARSFGLTKETLGSRLDFLGWSIERALTQKVDGRIRTDNVMVTFQGETKYLSEWARVQGMKPNTLQQRLYRGWSVEDALTRPLRE